MTPAPAAAGPAPGAPAPPWEAYLESRFPGYLLPHACHRALPEDAAARFLERLGGRPEQLRWLRAASVMSRHGDDIREFAVEQLPRLASSLPPRTEAVRRTWDGRVLGRLDVAATLRNRLQGRISHFVGAAPVRALDRPETVLVKAVARRVRDLLRALEGAGLLRGARWGLGRRAPSGDPEPQMSNWGLGRRAPSGDPEPQMSNWGLGRRAPSGDPEPQMSNWGAGLAGCAAALERSLEETALRAVEDAPVTAFHELAARAAPHPAYPLAARLGRALEGALDAPDPAATARALAEGALAPAGAATRFELAVLLRLIEALEARLDAACPGRWSLHRTAVLPGRRDVADFASGGAHLRVHYNQACLAPGPHDLGLRRYFGHARRLRPDVTVVMEPAGRPPRAAVVEVKLSTDPEYLVQGYREALLYRTEYAAHLTGWPKAILVTPAPVESAPRPEDDVVAIGWDRWVPDAVLDGLLEGFE